MASVRSASLTFRGFDIDAVEVERLIGVKAESLGSRGLPVKQGVTTLLVRSYVRYECVLDRDMSFDDALRALVAAVGGWQRLIVIRGQIAAEFVDVSLVTGTRKSDEQEDSFVSPHVLHQLAALGATLSFEFP